MIEMKREVFNKNWIFLLFVLVGILCLIKKDNELTMDVVPYIDSQIEFSAEQGGSKHGCLK